MVADAAYTFAEGLGVRFELAGEILPDPTAPGGLPLARCADVPLPVFDTFAPSPTFDYRGLQPFHDFPEGPDWWDTQHYKQIITQLSKMKANFLGLHTCKYLNAEYLSCTMPHLAVHFVALAGRDCTLTQVTDPYSNSKTPGTGTDEPTVWVGPVSGLNSDGSIKPEYAYNTSYANTMRNEWGYGSVATSNYSWGTSEIFETDCWAPPPSDTTSCPQTTTPATAAAFFERVSTLLNDSFAHGNTIGVEGCVGTETPLSYQPAKSGSYPCEAHQTTCYQDSETRILPHTVSIEDGANTVERCAYECYALNYSIAGVEYGQVRSSVMPDTSY